VIHQQVSDLICRFQQAFDRHDWNAMRACLDDDPFVDYSSFRGTEPERISADEYVRLRQQALSNLLMQHNHSNLAVRLHSDERASATCNYQIFRFERHGDRQFHSFGTYEFGLVLRRSEWRISSITQHLIQNEGDQSIHGGVGR